MRESIPNISLPESTLSILKAAIAANRSLAELMGIAESLPNLAESYDQLHACLVSKRLVAFSS